MTRLIRLENIHSYRACRIGTAAVNTRVDTFSLAAALELGTVTVAHALWPYAFFERIAQVSERAGAYRNPGGV